MSGATKKTEYETMVGPKPLPAHFGQIDPNAPFDAKRFFTMLRCSGINPIAIRQNGNSVSVSFDVGRDETALQRKRIATANAWADAQDANKEIRGAYVREILGDLKSSYLG